MTFTTDGGVTAFFKAFEEALKSKDPDPMTAIYHTSFLFGGPKGAQAVKLEDFLKVIPHRAEFARKIGLTQTRLVSAQAAPLDAVYVLATTVWEMTVERPGTERHLESTKASYIMLKQDNSYRIVVQIDHQDLMERLEKNLTERFP